MSPKSLALIVDDDPDFREVLSAALAQAGYEVVAAADGEEGLRLYDARRPAVMVVDGHLPGIDGFEVCREVRKRPGSARTALILCTVRSALSTVEAGVEAGADDYVLKPFVLPELFERVKAARERADRR